MKSFDTFKDLQVTLEKDRPGALAKATTAIANAGINIGGFCEIDEHPGIDWFQQESRNPQFPRNNLEGFQPCFLAARYDRDLHGPMI